MNGADKVVSSPHISGRVFPCYGPTGPLESLLTPNL